VTLEYVINNLLPNIGYEIKETQNPASILIAEYLMIELIIKYKDSVSLDKLKLK